VAGGVSLLFAGHDHLYERGIGTVAGHPGVALPYVVTGGGGAPLYNPTCQTAGPSGSLPPPSSSPTLPTSLSVAPLPPCPSSVAIVRKAYHYLVVEVDVDEVDAHAVDLDTKPAGRPAMTELKPVRLGHAQPGECAQFSAGRAAERERLRRPQRLERAALQRR